MWYTGRGDEGFTGLIGGERVAKDAPRIEALGELDEATSAIGAARAFCARQETGPVLRRVQGHLSLLMTEVATPDPARLAARLTADAVDDLEAVIAALDTPGMRTGGFILPGDTRGGALLDVARAVTRRAERRVAGLAHQGEVRNVHLLRYLNRLSTLLYLLARAEELAEENMTRGRP